MENRQKNKSTLHPRNKHHGRYDLEVLAEVNPDLRSFIHKNKYDDLSIDFFNPKAVRALNTALLLRYYSLDYWGIPADYLCPPIPGRADYIHYLADLLSATQDDTQPENNGIKCLDIGVGANCIYPIIGVADYAWTFVGSDIDERALVAAAVIVDKNPSLRGKIEFRRQSESSKIFNSIIKPKEYFDAVLCNPPFHASRAEAQAASRRKVSNLKSKSIKKPVLNFGGQSNELFYAGGEKKFINLMIVESKLFQQQVGWFTTLVSKESNLPPLLRTLDRIYVKDVNVIEMGQGNKRSRMLAWRF